MKPTTALLVVAALLLASWPVLTSAQAPAAPAATARKGGGGQRFNTVRYFTTPAPVGHVACSPDGKLIAVANADPTLILQAGGASRVKDNWKPLVDVLDALTGKPIVSLKLTTPDEDAMIAKTPQVTHVAATALAFSPDGKIVAVGTSIGQVKLFDAATGEVVRALDDANKAARAGNRPDWEVPRAMGSVASLAFSPDGTQLAACGLSFADFSLRFDRPEVRRAGRLRTGPDRLKLWDVKTAALKHDLAGHSHVQAVAFSPDGAVLASTGRWEDAKESGAGALLWDAASGAKLRAIPVEANGGVHAVAFTTDGKRVAVTGVNFQGNEPPRGTLCIAAVETGVVDCEQTFPGRAAKIAFQRGGALVLLCGGRIDYRDGTSGQILSRLMPDDKDGRGKRWTDLAFAKSGGMHVMAGTDAETGKGTIDVIDPDNRDPAPEQPVE